VSQTTVTQHPGDPRGPSPNFLAAGALVKGRYRILRPLSQGGMGALYLGEDLRLRREVVLKTLKHWPDVPTGREERQARRFRREVRITACLQHPGIPQVYDSGCLPNRRPYFVMQFIRGADFAKVLLGRVDLRDNLQQHLDTFRSVALATAHAHQLGVVHRDIKPNNVYVSSDGNGYLLDWGLAALLDQCLVISHDLKTPAGHCAGGVPRLMSPEQRMGQPTNRRFDVFLLGGLLYFILSGEYPNFDPATGDAAQQGACHETLLRAAHARLDELDRTGGMGLWIDLAKWCLAVAEQDRPAGATVVHAAVLRIPEEISESVRAAEAREERRKASAEVRTLAAAEALKRQRLLLRASVVIGLAVFALITTAALYLDHRANASRDHDVRVEKAHEVVTQALDRAKHALQASNPNLGEIDLALAAAGERLLPEHHAELADALHQHRADRRAIERLDAVNDRRWSVAEDGRRFDAAAARDEWLAVFRDYGIRFENANADAAMVRESVIVGRLTLELERFFAVGGSPKAVELLHVLDSDRDRHRLRLAYLRGDATLVAELIAKVNGRTAPAAFAELVGTHPLTPAADRLRVLEAAQAAHPCEFGLAMAAASHQPKGVMQKRIAYYQVAVALRPGNTAARLNLANARRAAGEHDVALAGYDQLLASEPKFAAAHVGRGNTLLGKKDFSGARAAFVEATRLDPRFGHAWNGIGNLDLVEGNHPAAAAAFETAIGFEKTNPTFHYNRATALFHMAKYDEAIVSYEEADRLRPEEADTLLGLGNCWRAKRDATKAHAYYQRALLRDPRSSTVHNAIGNALYDQGDYTGAVAKYRLASEFDPESPLPLNGWGNALLSMKELNGAEAKFTRATIVDPAYAEPHNGLGNIALKRGDPVAAARSFATAAEKAPRTALYQFNRGVALVGAKKLDAAMEAYTLAIGLDPLDPRPLVNRSELFLNQGKLAAALTDLDGAIARNPGLVEAHLNRGTALAGMENRAAAREAFGKVQVIDPRHSRAHYNLSLLDYQEKEYHSAIEHARKAAEFDPTFSDAHALLGSTLLDSGDPAGARRPFARAAELNRHRWGHLPGLLPSVEVAPAPRPVMSQSRMSGTPAR